MSAESDLVPMEDGDGTVDRATGEVVAEVTPSQARKLTDEIAGRLDRVWDGVMDAYLRRAWAALGFPSWNAYCDHEFRECRFVLPREDRPGVVQSLADAGLSQREIAAATGLSKGSVGRALTPGAPNGAPEDRGGSTGSSTSPGAPVAPDPASTNADAGHAAGDSGVQPEEAPASSGAAGSDLPVEPAAETEHEPNPLAVALEARKRLNAAMKAMDAAAAVPLMDAEGRISFAGTLAAVQDWVNGWCDELENAPGLTLVQGAAS